MPIFSAFNTLKPQVTMAPSPKTISGIALRHEGDTVEVIIYGNI